MTRRSAARQRGVALLIMVVIVGLGATWYLVSRLNTESGLAGAAYKVRNQRVLDTAKATLIGYVAAQAAKAGENRPGALPCPEAPADFNVSASEGTVAYPCTLPIVGRFPWKTLGLDKLVDASGEPLWYAVAPGWAGVNTVINSDCASPSSGMACATGRLTVDGATDDVIALIIAPGARLNVTASANCTAWSQARSTTGPPDARNYLECQNATWPADLSFATTGPSGSFNDQVVRVTVGEILSVLEAAIANRIQREIVPALNTVYTPSAWGFAGSNPLYPWAATFINPGPGAGSSNYRGMGGGSATYQGLLPFNRTQCTASASDPRCMPALITWNGTPSWGNEVYGYGYIQTQNCYWASADIWECTGEYHEYDTQPWRPIRIEVTANLNFVTRGLRKIDTSKMTVEARDNGTTTWETQTVTNSAVMNSNGGVAITFGAVLPNIDVKGWGTYAEFRIRVDRAVIGDHSLLDPNDSTTGWFARNEWFRVAYYAVAQGYTNYPLPSAPSCTTGSSCVTVANVTPAGAQRAILILAGRSINGNPRPSSTLADYLEFGNRMGTLVNFEKQTVTSVKSNTYSDTGAVNAFAIPTSAVVGKPVQFKAANANSGASTLTAGAVGPASLVNADGSGLAGSQIQPSAVAEVIYDGTQFKMYKRPFNDRVIVIGSN